MQRSAWTIPFLLIMSAWTAAQTPGSADTKRRAGPLAGDNDLFGVTLSPSDVEEVDRLIPQLGSNDYTAREQATKRLTAIGVGSFERLRSTYLESDDLEVRLRIEEIVHDTYLTYRVYRHYGFLGISQRGMPFTHRDDPRILAGHVGIGVGTVHEHTGAKRAGLKSGDVIIALDGEFIKEDFLANANFGAMIREHGPDTAIKLTILRKRRRLDIDATLGKVPAGIARSGGIAEVPEQLLLAEQQFPTWWASHFHGKKTASEK